MPQESQKNNAVAIIIAIIGVIGAVIAATITMMGNYNIEKLRQDTELTRTALILISTQDSALPIFTPTPIIVYSPTFTTTPTANMPTSTTTITPPPPISEQQALQWPVIFSENFDANSNGWTTGFISVARLETTRSIENGKYLFDVKSVERGAGLIMGRPAFKSLPATYFYASADVKQISGTDSGSYGLIFKSYTGDYFTFEINSQQKFAIYYGSANSNEAKTVLGWTKSSAIIPYAVNNLTIISYESHFYFFINHQYIGAIKNNEVPEGEIGVEVSLYYYNDSAKFEFDNLEIRSP